VGLLARDMSIATNRPINKYGLTEINGSCIGANVDIVFVHGLNGHPEYTWTSGGDMGSGIFSHLSFCPPFFEEEKARILVYGYHAHPISFMDGVSGNRIHNHAEHLIAELCANRRTRKATERPIIFVAHSLGGLVAKRALIYSSEVRGNHTEHLRSIYVSTHGILFLATPHMGADLAAWCPQLRRIWGTTIPGLVFVDRSQVVGAFENKCEILQNIDRQFIQLTHRYHVYFFHEGKPIEISGVRFYVVDEESAAPVIQDVERACIQQGHAQMCKFEDENTPGFSLVAEGIQRYAAEAPAIIQRRWEAEKAERQRSKELAAKEIIGITESATPKESPRGSAGHVTDRMAPSDLGPVQRHPPPEPQYSYSINFLNFFGAYKQSHRSG